MKSWLCFLFFFSMSVIHGSAHAEKIKRVSFDELPRLVAERNENVDAANFHIQSSEARTGRQFRSFLPHFAASLGGEQFKTGTDPLEKQTYWRIESSLNLYNGGRDSIEESIRKSQVTLAKINRSNEFQVELREAKQAFWQSIAISKLIAEKKEAIDKNEINLKSSRRRAGAGITTTADAAQFEIHKVALQREQRKLEHEFDVVLNRLSVAIALDEHENLELVGGFPDIAKLPAVVEFKSPDQQLSVRTSREMQKVEELRATQNSRWWRPKLDVYASYGVPSLSDEYTRALRNEHELTAGLKLSVDIGQGFEEQRETAARRAQSMSLSRRSAHAVREAIALDHELRHEMGILSELISNADQDVERAQKFLKLTESEYSRGVKNGPDLLDAFQKYFEIRGRRIENYQEYFEIRSQLESLVARTNENGDL